MAQTSDPLGGFQIDFSKPPSCYWSTATQMSYLQRRIIVWSIMYYDRDESCVPDAVYDGVSRQLVRMLNRFPEAYKKTKYYYAMSDFDGSTGFDIASKLTPEDREYLCNIVGHVHQSWQAANGIVTGRRKAKQAKSHDTTERSSKSKIRG